MTLGLQNPQAVGNPFKAIDKSPQAVLESKELRFVPDFTMANVPGQGEEEGTPKEAFDASAIRPSYQQQPGHRLGATFPAQVPLAPQPHPSQMVQSAQMVHASNILGQPSSLGQPSPIGPSVHYAAPVDNSKPRDQLNSYDLFPEINVPTIVPTSQDITREGTTNYPIDPKAPQPPHGLYERKPQEPMFYQNLPVAGSSSRVTKRGSRSDIHDNSPSPSLQSPTSRGLTGQSSLERRKAHRAYTQKSRNKVNSRFEALLDALPTPPPRLNPRSKAEILEYATETVIRLVSQNNKLELHLALSSSPQLEAWLTDQTQSARTVREVCQPIMRLFTIGLEWKGAEVWAIDSRAPMNTASLGQAWTFVPPPSGRGPSREEETKMTELTGFLDSGKGQYYTTTSNEALAVVYRTGKPAWLSCEYKASVGFEEQEFATDRTRLAQSYGISDVLFVPLILYNHVQIVVTFYNMRSRGPSQNPTLQPQIDPKSSIKVASEAIAIVARRFCSLPGVSEFNPEQ